MDLSLNVDVHCLDGRCGRSTYIIINPATDQVTHLIVREQWPSRTERMVPVEKIAITTRDVIVLNQTRADFTTSDSFNQTDFVYTNVPHYATDPSLTLLWPYVVPAKRVIEDNVRRIPVGELAVRRGAKVQATDGRVGRVDEFVVDTEDGQITHLVLRDDKLWGQKEITIPVAFFDRFEENTVYLSIDRSAVGDLPAIPVQRRW
jgi:sporulation protein YlmC with PRC-barrel domain